MTRILLLTAILVAALSVSAFAADPDTTTSVSLTINGYVTISGGGSASGTANDAAYDTGSIDLTENSTDLTLSSNDEYWVRAKISDDFIGDSNSNHPNLKLTVSGNGASGQLTLTQSDQIFVNYASPVDDEVYTQDYVMDGITTTNLPADSNSGCTVLFTIAQS